MQQRSTQHVPGKVILVGEHAGLHGRSAIAMCLPPQLALTAMWGPPGRGSPLGDARLREALATAAAFFGLDPLRVKIRTRSQLPVGVGLGSSAALSVALVRALADLCGAGIGHAELQRAATEVEHAFHGRSSGLDVHAVASGGLIWFEPGPEPLVSRIDVPASFDLVVGMSGRRRSTAVQVDALKNSHDGAAASMRRLGELSRAAHTTLTSGDIAALGRIMDLAHTELVTLGTSAPTLDRMTALARQAGAVGAKLTGAGHGGAVIALAPDRACSRRVLTALHAAGFDAFITPVAGHTATVAGTPSGASADRPEHPHALQVRSQVENVRA